MACPSNTSAVSRGTAIPASSRRRAPCRNAVCTVIPRLVDRALFRLLLHLFALVVSDQRVEDSVHLALHHEIELVERQADAVIAHAILREVVGADLLTAVARPHHALALRAQHRLLLFQLQLVQAGTQHSLGLGAILDLRFFVLAGNHQAGGQVGDAHGRIRGVDALPAGAGGTEGIDADVLGLDLDLNFVGFGQDRHRDGGGMHAALLLRYGHALHAVHATFVLQFGVDLGAGDQRDHVLEAADAALTGGGDYHLPALGLRVARVHAEDLGGEQHGLIAARAGADFEDDVLIVVGVLGQQQDLEIFLDLHLLRLQFRDFHFRHGLEVGVRLQQHGTRLGQAVFDLLPFAILDHDVGKFAPRLGDLAVLIRVANDGRIGHLLGELVKTFFELIELRSKMHGGLCDDQLAALLLLERHGAFERADGNRRLLVGRGFGGDALQPQAGRRHGGQHRAAPLGGKADEFVTDARNQRQQRDAAQEFGQKAIERNERVEHNGNDDDHEQEAGAAARMESRELLRIFHRHRQAGFEIKDYFVLRAVKLKDAMDILHQGQGEHEQDKDEHADQAISQVKRDAPAQRRIDALQPGGEVQGNELVHEKEHTEGDYEVGGQHPAWDFLRFLVIFLLFLLDFFQRNVRRELERLHAKRHRLGQRAYPAENGVFENLVLVGHPGERHFLGHNVTVGFTNRHAVAVRSPHHDTFHDGLSADEGGFLAAFQDRH